MYLMLDAPLRDIIILPIIFRAILLQGLGQIKS